MNVVMEDPAEVIDSNWYQMYQHRYIGEQTSSIFDSSEGHEPFRLESVAAALICSNSKIS
jgi:hypothetical protein